MKQWLVSTVTGLAVWLAYSLLFHALGTSLLTAYLLAIPAALLTQVIFRAMRRSPAGGRGPS